MSRCRRYAFTLAKDAELWYGIFEKAIEYKEFPDEIEYMCGQLETCPTTGTVHFQGYLRLSRAMTIVQVKKLSIWQHNDAVHLETCKGSEDQNIEYCNKDDTRYKPFREYGRRATPGKAKTAEDFAKSIKDGKTDAELLDEHPALYIRHFKAVQHIRTNVLPAPRRGETKFIYCYGEPGSGKSQWATKIFARGDYYNASQAPKWWDGYNGQKIVIIDDFVSNGWRHDFINQMGSDIDMRVEIKGGTTPFLAEWVIFTSNWTPDQHFRSPTTRQAFCRRVKRWLYFHGDNWGFWEYANYGDFNGDVLRPPGAAAPRQFHTRDVLINTDDLPEAVIHPFLNLTQD